MVLVGGYILRQVLLPRVAILFLISFLFVVYEQATVLQIRGGGEFLENVGFSSSAILGFICMTFFLAEWRQGPKGRGRLYYC